jgi:hypothetical protein
MYVHKEMWKSENGTDTIIHVYYRVIKIRVTLASIEDSFFDPYG